MGDEEDVRLVPHNSSLNLTFVVIHSIVTLTKLTKLKGTDLQARGHLYVFEIVD